MDASKALLERVAAAAGELSKAERKVALAVTSSPEIVSTETIAALSKRAGVSEPTVCRFCKSLGFEGFPDFKNALSVALLTTRPAAHSEVRQGDSVQDVANKVLPGLGYLVAFMIVLGGLVFNIGNVGGCALGFNTLLGIPETIGYVLSGSVTINLGKQKFRAKKGESFYYTPDKTHFLSSKSGAVVLWISSPPSF